MKTFILLTLTLYSFKILSQSDTVWLTYPSLLSQNTVSVFGSSEFYGILNSEYDLNENLRFFSITLTDYNGNVIRVLNPIVLNDSISLLSIEHIQFNGDSILLLANIKFKDNTNAFISAILDPELAVIEIVDTLDIPIFTELRFDSKFKLRPNNIQIENFGSLISESNGNVQSNIYLNLSNVGDFITYSEVPLLMPSYLLDFEWIESMNNYFITSWNRTSSILDSQMQLIYSGENVYQFILNDTTYFPLYTYYGCSYNNGELFCGGVGGPKNHFNFIASNIHIDSSLIRIDTIFPLLPNNTKDDIVSAEFELDLQGNSIAVATSLFNPFNHSVDINTTYITKYHPNAGILWQLTLSNNYEIVVTFIFIDNNNDILLGGSYWASDSPRPKGFVLKINEDGSLINSQFNVDPDFSFLLYPNPVDNIINVVFQDAKIRQLSIYNATGNKLFTQNLYNQAESVSVSDLTPGIYFASVNGSVRKFIKQ